VLRCCGAAVLQERRVDSIVERIVDSIVERIVDSIVERRVGMGIASTAPPPSPSPCCINLSPDSTLPL